MGKYAYILFITIVGIIVLPFSRVGAIKIPLNSEGKTESEGAISTHLVGKCGQDYRLVTPQKADVWKINITIISELSTQPVHIKIYEVIGEYPYNYEEQTNVPYARGTGEANLVVQLDTSKIYEIWIRDAYAREFTGTIIENWHPYVRNGGLEERDPTRTHFCKYWVDMGHTGYGSGENTYENSMVLGLQQESYPSNMWQEVILDRKDLVFSFWFRPYPEGTNITFQAFFDDIPVYNSIFSGEYTDYNWRQVLIFLEPVFINNNLETGEHKIEFIVPASNLPHAWVEIDEVAIEKATDFEKIGVEIWCETNKDHIEIGDPIEISGQIIVQSTKIVSLTGIPIELSYSINEGITWWYLTSVTIDQNNDFQHSWTPMSPGEHVVRALIPENDYLLEFEAWTAPLSVGSIVSIDSYEISDSRSDVGTSQYVKFHVSYVHSETAAENIIVVINGTEYISDESGWINLFASENIIGKSKWNIDSVTNVDDYNILIDEPTIIWDEIEVFFESPQRLSITSDAVEWSGKYLYDDEYFDGSLIFNDTLSKAEVGRYSYRVMGVVDTKYGLEKFSANNFDVIFDSVALIVSIANNRIDITDIPEITVTGHYEYDNQYFAGYVNFIQPISQVVVGEYPILVKSIEDPLYGLTSLQQNEVTCIWDRVKIVDGGVTNEVTTVKKTETVWFKAEYEYDSDIFDASDGILYLNDEPMEWSSSNQRWEKYYSSDSPETMTFKITGVRDDTYRLTTINNAVGTFSIEWKQVGIPGFIYESIILGLIAVIIILWHSRNL